MKKKIDELPFTWESLQKELDTYRIKGNEKHFTPEQKEFLLKCRDNENPIPYSKMAELWEKLGWGKVAYHSMREWYKKVKL
jgi:hypothetical protein